MRRITKTQLRKIVRQSDIPVRVSVSSCNLQPGMTMWKPFVVKLYWNDDVDGGLCVDGRDLIGYHGEIVRMSFETWLNEWSYYNADYERGYYAHYYI